MRKMLLASLLLLGGCGGQISQNPIQTAVNNLLPTPAAKVLVTDIQDANWNLQQAQSIGILSPTDPVQGCLADVMAEAGIPAQGAVSPSPVPSFTPENGGLVSLGSIGYILAMQAKQLTGNPAALIPASCQQVVGNLVVSALLAPQVAAVNAISAGLPGTPPALLQKGK
jgi:hypothetical protein